MRVDLHLHSTASDGAVEPQHIPEYARRGGLNALALTDHDTVQGVVPLREAAAGTLLDVVAGCEISTGAPWGELHLLAYYLPTAAGPFSAFLELQLERRRARAMAIVERLYEFGVGVPMSVVEEQADGGAITRPHIARALVQEGRVSTTFEAFARFLSDSAPGNVPKELPEVGEVAELVRRVGGVTSAAHLKERGGKKNLKLLKDAGVDGVEVLHPSHDAGIVNGLMTQGRKLDMLFTGGSDWHGPADARRGGLGSQDVPQTWLEKVETLHRERAAS